MHRYRRILLGLLRVPVFSLWRSLPQEMPTESAALAKIETRMEAHPDVSPFSIIQVINRYQQQHVLSAEAIAYLEKLVRSLEEVFYHPSADETLQEGDCYADEYFDSEQQRCMPAAFLEDSGLFATFLEEHVGEKENFSARTQIEEVYTIEGDEITPQLPTTQTPEHELIREVFTRIIPAGFRKDLGAYSVFDDTNWQDAALITQLPEEPTKRLLLVNQDAFFPGGTFDPSGSIYTLVHEFAHLLTLNQSQMVYYPQDAASVSDFEIGCQTHLVQEGCLREISYLEAFLDIFRTPEDAYVTEHGETERAAQAIYKTHPEDFVTEYASTNPAEDIAESFVFFILESKPTGSTAADRKIAFFRSYPELVTLRIHMRNRLRQLTSTDN